ncbi:hypothetical protein CAOG_009254 [Capsaspora owczarzaki ATCC 30864]|uniref:Uncharacterized protein n=3 Tax=Capsaspora owczarzaki (strain ATCC 30864) TaxID=595528 RepID=A0A0D2TZI5_CAPO3|nr:hypothetical protein CAOG_009254 [Capsaspora owczarzaki ATCC 30864]
MQVDGASSSVAFSSGSSIAASLSRGVRLDVMPYAEQDLQDEQASANVLALIQAEMATLPQRDYLASLNLPASDQLFASRPRLQQELAR